MAFKSGFVAIIGKPNVGKSTLLNAILKKKVAIATPKPQTTRDNIRGILTMEDCQIVFIDTPGIRGFGTFDFEPEEVGHYFREIFLVGRDCRFGNCTHTHEPGCAVLKALDNHKIAESRYASYLSMLEDKDEDRYR